MFNNVEDTDFESYLLAFQTFAYGLFIFFSNRYLVDRFSISSISPSVEDITGWIILLIAIAKFIGLYKNIKALRRLGIVGMTVIWAFIVGLYVFEALDFQFLGLIMTLPVLIRCLRVARRGDYTDVYRR